MSTPVPGHTVFRPATTLVADLVRGVRDEHLDALTPCGGITVGALLDHIDSLSLAFAAAGRKEKSAANGPTPEPDGARLGADWRERLPARLDALETAWRPAAAWEGVTVAGGLDLPGHVAGAAGLDEVLVHGWDLAVATGQPFPAADDGSMGEALGTAFAWVHSIVEQNPQGTPGLFGPPVAVPEDAQLLDRLLGLTGRDPAWSPTGQGRVA
jgi:uncharacterized protein (TIGR03086 family)